jgi:predicted enzyme related to lactoylglutathione lyase
VTAARPKSRFPLDEMVHVELCARLVGELGGAVIVGPMAILQGSRIAAARDPQGAVFALFEGETED